MPERAVPRPTEAKVELVKGLGLADATLLVIGSMIGSGLFIVSADVARQLNSPGGLILTWLVTAFLTIVGALSFGELAAMMPRAGGMYVFLREAYSPLLGFLYGWTVFLVIGSATIAAVAIAFAKFTGVFLPWFSSTHWLWKIGTVGTYTIGLHTQNLLAILSIVALTWVNARGLRSGAMAQNVLTLAKVAGIVVLIVFGLTLGRNPQALEANFTGFWRNLDWSGHTLTVLAVAMVGPLFAAFAWENATFTAAETKEAKRNLPLCLLLGTGTVMVLYLLTNLSYLTTLPLAGSPQGSDVLARGIQYAAEDRVAAASGEVIFGTAGAYFMAAAIMISTFGCNNGLILSYARVYFAMARDKLFFARLGELNPKTHTPNAALFLQGVWASLLTLTGTYSDLLDYVIFAQMLFYILTIAALFVLRRSQPQAERPYRTFGYPVLPVLYIAISAFIEICILVYKPRYTWPGLILVALGIPAYWLWRRPRTRNDS
ncbi:MAG TPA: amino acid permease [Candidatus Xenobia bacterium]|nr:amino acid permease [Candidatus Xenobia bacterium]